VRVLDRDSRVVLVVHDEQLHLLRQGVCHGVEAGDALPACDAESAVEDALERLARAGRQPQHPFELVVERLDGSRRRDGDHPACLYALSDRREGRESAEGVADHEFERPLGCGEALGCGDPVPGVGAPAR